MTRSLIQWCRNCNRPTLQPRCSQCGGTTVNPLPPRFSPEDPYGKYRRAMKRRMEEEARVA